MTPQETLTGILELSRRDAWIAQRFGLKERKYTDAPGYRRVLRFRLDTLDESALGRLEGMLHEQRIEHRFLSKSQARERPEYKRPGA